MMVIPRISILPPPPVPPRVGLATLLHLRPDRGRLVSAARALVASGLCLFAGWALDDLAAGLNNRFGRFCYGSGRPYQSRKIAGARAVRLCVLGRRRCGGRHSA